MEEFILELRNITKSFHGVAANDGISLKIKRGEIHALLGENGAGKSTLMNILAGLYIPDSGDIFIKGKQVEIKSPRDSISLGIGMVHQHFKLVQTLTVAENILMGHQDLKFMIKKHEFLQQLADVSESYNLPIKPEIEVYKLSAGEMQRVEIVKMLYRNVDLLILDEPTSVLTPQESQELFKNLLRMKDQGKTVIFISHKLAEVMQIADRVTVLRRGKVIQTLNKEDTNAFELSRIMIGRELKTSTRKNPYPFDLDKVVLKAQDLYTAGENRETVLDNVCLEISSGEILGVAGVSGNGQSYLAKCLTGMYPLAKGQVLVDGEDLSQGSSKQYIKAGVGHVPEDRIGVGCIANFSCVDNLILKAYHRPPIKQGFRIKPKEAISYASKLIEEFDVRTASIQMPVRFLSGGNMQKLIFAREISENPRLIVAVHPTYGLDVSAVEMVHKFLLNQQQKGCAVLLISEDLDEVLELADNISVMYKGTLTPKKKNSDCSIDDLGFAMMGINSPEDQEEVAPLA